MSVYHTCTAPGIFPLAEENAVRLEETGGLFNTLAEAIAAAQSAGLSAYTLVVVGNTTQPSDVIITADVRIVAEGEHSVTMAAGSPPRRFAVEGGGTLILGGGTAPGTLTITAPVTVTDGSIYVQEGAVLRYSGNAALRLSGAAARGSIVGGRLEGGAAGLSMDNGAQLSEISGGAFYGREDALLLSGAGTRIELISGGSFHQTDPNVSLHGHGVMLDNTAQIGRITGGYFEALRNNALSIVRGSRVEEISGGDFYAARVGSAAGNDRNAALRVTGIGALTGIGSISGGYFHGSYYGLLAVQSGAPVQIDRITGGSFTGTYALQNDIGCLILEISGASFSGGLGLFNNGSISHIGGTAEFHGSAADGGQGIFNYNNGQIAELGGGTVVSDSGNGISNSGTIALISGGTVVGGLSAISCTGINRGRLGTISGGTFWGKNGPAILLAYSLNLEPGLGTLMGSGRYWGSGGMIFNNDSLVVYPYSERYDTDYRMSLGTVPVAGLPGTEFRFLEVNADFFTVTVHDSFAAQTGAGVYTEGETVHIDAGLRAGYRFAGWAVSPGSVSLADPESPMTAFVMPPAEVTLTAQWTAEPVLYTVTVLGSHADDSGAEMYPEGETVSIRAGSWEGHHFTGWTVTSGSAVLADPASPVTTFPMPANDVTVTANWEANPSVFTVTVLESVAANSGAGDYSEGARVMIRAGSREGYTFSGWTVNSGAAVLTQPGSPVTSFLMPQSDVTLTANWNAILFTVVFLDWDGTVLSIQQVAYGENALPPTVLPRPGYVFTSWSASYTNVQTDLSITAQYEPAPPQPVQVKLRAKKRLRGGCLQEGMFTFALFDCADNEVARAVNDSCGEIEFLLELSQPPGCYAFTLRELGPLPGCVTDQRSFPVLVTLRARGAKVCYPKGRPIFVNRMGRFAKK